MAASRATVLVTSYSCLEKVAATRLLYPGLELVVVLEAECEGERELAGLEGTVLPWSQFLADIPATRWVNTILY